MTKKKDFFLRVQRVAKNRVKSQHVSKNGYASPEHEGAFEASLCGQEGHCGQKEGKENKERDWEN